jgi:serine O-acetyltransferase
MTLKNTLRLIAADTRERCRLEQKRYGIIPYLKLLQNPPALVVTIFRFQHWLHRCGWTGLAEVLRRLNIVLFTTDIDSRAEIGEHFILFHANCIHIGDRVRIGNNVYLVHHNTIATGPRPDEQGDDAVVIDDNVVVGCGARILGNVTVGHDTFIGAGAVVMETLPECSFHFSGPGETVELA